MALQKEGVILSAMGASAFISALNQATKASKGLFDTLSKAGPSSAKATSALGGLGKTGALVKGALGTAGVAAIGATAAIGGLVVGLGALGGAMAKLARETAPIQGIAAQFGTLTQTVEGGSQGMMAALQAGSMGMIAQRDLMTQFNSAAALVSTQFAERLPEALGLLSKVSVATGEDMGYMMDSLVKGVGRVSPMILDNLKIQVGVAEATQRASEMFGVEAEALTKLQQQTAIMDITMEKLTEKFGDLPDTSQTAAAQMGIFGARMQDIKDTLGQFLLPAFANFMSHVNRLTGAFLALISEGGGLYPILVNIGAALSIVGDAFGKAVDVVVDFVESLNVDAANSFQDFINNAFEWGTNIVTSLANGITEAATTVLDIAMRSIENALTFWLAPGSPPKVAPQLRNWGVDYMGELLGGMTEADWGILESIQGPLKKVLGGPEFASASKAITESLTSGDRAGALDTIRKQTGAFGAELAELAQHQFEVADATIAVEEAEKQLEAARQRQLMSQRQVDAETAKYNELLREGASDEILDAQLARINMAERERDTAAQVSEEQLSLAQERKAAAEDEASLQQKVVDELLAYNDALTEQEKAEGKVRTGAGAAKGKGGAAAATEVSPVPGGPKLDIAGRIGAAIAASKEKLLTAFSGLFAPLGEAWDTGLAKIGEKWDAFVLLIGTAWTDIKTKWPGLQVLEDWIVGLPEKIGTMIVDGWDKLMTALDAIWDFVETYLLPIVVDLGVLGFEALKFLVLQFLEAWTGEDGLYSKLEKVWAFIKDDLIPKIIGEDGLGPALAWLNEKVVTPLKDGLEWLRTALESVHTWLGKVIETLKKVNLDTVAGLMGKSPSPLAIGIQTAADAMERMARVSLPKFNAAMSMTPAMTPAYAGVGGSTYNNQRSMSANFNTTINNGMNEAEFTAKVRRVMMKELRHK